MINVKIDGLKEAISELEKLSDGTYTKQLLGHVAQRIFDKAWQGADKHTKTGALIRSIGSGPRPWGNGGYAIGHDDRVAPHAKWVHDGTRAHVITPKDKKALRWPVAGGFAFAKKVNHPGYKGDPYLVDALRDAENNLQTDVDKIEREIDQ